MKTGRTSKEGKRKLNGKGRRDEGRKKGKFPVDEIFNQMSTRANLAE